MRFPRPARAPPPNPHAGALWRQESRLFTEPVFGYVDLDIDSYDAERLDTRWHSVRAEDVRSWSPDIEAEVLITLRRFHSNASVCPRDGFDSDDSEEGLNLNPSNHLIDHSTAAMKPIDDPFPILGPPPVRDRRPTP